MNRKQMCGVVFAALGVTFAQAQVSINPAVRADNGNTGPGIETAIVASKLAPGELVVGWIDWRTGKNEIGYAISLDAGAAFTDAVLVVPNGLGPTLPSQNAADPMVACDPLTGDLWIGGFSTAFGSSPNGLFIARKPLGSASLDASQVIGGVNTGGDPKTDKPLMAAGVDPANPTHAYLHVAYARSWNGPASGLTYNANNKLAFLRVRIPDINAPGAFGPAWAGAGHPFNAFGTNDPYQSSFGAFPVVIPMNAPANRGRLVIPLRPEGWCSIYTNDPAAPSPVAWLPDALPFINSLFSGVEAATYDDIPGPFRTPALQSVSVDPATGWVYALVAARRESGSANVDLWVHRSVDQGATWPANQVFHLTDADLGTTAQAHRPDQFMPALAIDDFGGVNLLWYDTRHDGGLADDHPFALLDAYYARIVNVGGPLQTIEVHRLTAQSFTTWIDDTTHPYAPGGVANNPQFVGDYQWIAASGCSVYPCYMSAHTGERHVYVHRINLCPTDTDDSGLIATADAVLFAQLYPIGDARADINGDTTVNAADVLEFQARFAAGGP